MKQKVFSIIVIILSLVSAGKIYAQTPDTEEILGDLFSRIMETRNNDERIRINDSINMLIERYITSELIFEHRFENLKHLGQILSPDSRIKIITWNLLLTDGTNRYFCYIIRKGDHGGENRIYRLSGVNMDDPPRTDMTYSADNWYGALYYSIQPFRIGRETLYVVLGLDYTNLTLSTKIIDVLGFTDDGQITFGKKCFIRGDAFSLREVLEYSADGVVTLRFHNRKMIIFDHLVPVTSGQRDNPENYGAEYTFDAYVLKKGSWRFEKNVNVKFKQ
jgi:hypothetical protein